MADSDSDDELMSRLTRMDMSVANKSEDCCYCATPNASLSCTICNKAIYCGETCKRRHAPAHRNYCIKLRMEKEAAEESEEEESEEDESNSESEDVAHAPLSAGRKSSGGSAISSLTPEQIKKLLELATKADLIKSSSSIDKLQRQIAQLMADRTKGGMRERGTSGANSKEIQALQLKFSELEKKTQTAAYAPQTKGMMTMAKSVYTPLVANEDASLSTYLSTNMPGVHIQSKMRADGVSSDYLDTRDAIFSNEQGPEREPYIAMTVADDPEFKKYFQLKSMNMPVEQIKLKMKADGVDSRILDILNGVSPNDPGILAPLSPLQPASGGYSWPYMPAATPVVPYKPLYVKDDPKFQKYFKLRQFGLPDEQIKLKMKADEIDPHLLDCPNEVSPNDLGPPVQAPASPTGPVSMEQLFSILMQHQQIIQQVSNGGGGSGGARGQISSGGGVLDGMPLRSVEDQMAQELAAAESAIDDIFGDTSQQSKGSGGMSMIEQLEKKARKDSNKKLVENRKEVNRLIAELLTTKLYTDEEAIAFYKMIAPKLEEYGLALGSDAGQTWSSRLLIKDKESREWYFTEQERLDAGRAYGRLWGLSFLERDAGQLIAKRAQILNAPATMRVMAKGKPELIDKFTQLLKDTVKLKLKVFQNSLYAAEVRHLHTHNIPERLEERGTELIDSAIVLADASMDLAEEEFRLLENITRARKIRAVAVVHAAEKAVTLVGIVKKIGTNGVNETRLQEVQAKLTKIKELYLTDEKEEEEDDVV